MKILFVCGSVEPGKDGVGDYTRRLAGELIHRGHSCSIVAIMDQGVNVVLEEMQEIELTRIAVLRLPYRKGYQLNCLEAKTWIETFNPEWISLQYVPFSFQSKGLPYSLGTAIRKLAKERKLHLMFHELWIGMESNATFKHKCIGLLQQRIVSNFFSKNEIRVINTQTDLYKSKLATLGYNSELLPLFSNIIKNQESKVTTTTDVLELKFCLFGNIHHGSPVEKFINELKYVLSELKDKRVLKFIFIGHCGDAIEEWKKVLLANKIKFEISGFVTDMQISILLSSCQYGISTTPYVLSQKSGSLTAMVNHQIPVLCVARNWTVKGYNQKPFLNVINYENPETIVNFLDEKFIISNNTNIEFVVNNFLNGLR